MPISAEITKWTFKSSGVSFDAELLSYDNNRSQAVFKSKAGKKAQLSVSLFIDSDVDKIKAFTNSPNLAEQVNQNPINASLYKLKSLALTGGWAGGIGKAEGASEELLLILGGELGVPPSANLESSEDAFIYPGIRYLEDVKTAVALFFSKDVPLSAKKLIASPGFPASSIYSYDFKADLIDNYARYREPEENTFTHVSFVVDSQDQVVCIYFLHNNPPISGRNFGRNTNFKVYNFVDFRRKGSASYNIIRYVGHAPSLKTRGFLGGQIKTQTQVGEAIIKIEHWLFDGSGKAREHNTLYLPLLFANIMVHTLTQ